MQVSRVLKNTKKTKIKCSQVCLEACRTLNSIINSPNSHWNEPQGLANDNHEDDDLLTCGALKCPRRWLHSSSGVGSWDGRGGRSAAPAILLTAAVVGAAFVISDCGGPRVDARVRGVVGLLPLGHFYHAVCFAHCREQHRRAKWTGWTGPRHSGRWSYKED